VAWLAHVLFADENIFHHFREAVRVRRVEDEDAVRFQDAADFIQHKPKLVQVFDQLPHVNGVEKMVFVGQPFLDVALGLVGVRLRVFGLEEVKAVDNTFFGYRVLDLSSHHLFPNGVNRIARLFFAVASQVPQVQDRSGLAMGTEKIIAKIIFFVGKGISSDDNVVCHTKRLSCVGRIGKKDVFVNQLPGFRERGTLARMISIIFPAYNEAENLKRFPAEVVPEFEALGEPYEIIVVDDGSTKDETNAVARSLGGPVRVLTHEVNQGLGAAIRTGIREAKGDLIVTMDTDLTFAPRYVKDLLDRFRQGDVDVVSGSPKLAGYGKDIPSYRIFISKIANLVYQLLFGARVTAVSPIFRLYKREQLLTLPLQTTRFDINAEILFFLIRDGRRVAEIPVPLTQRIHGESNLDYRKEMIRHLKLIWRILKMRFRTSKSGRGL
jgi:dolichol-phosphate mannosyltransferase